MRGIVNQWKGNYFKKVTSNSPFTNNAASFYWPWKPCEIPLHSLKIPEDGQGPENKLEMNTTVRLKGAARQQQILGQNLGGSVSRSPSALIWVIGLAPHPVSTGFTILASSLTLFSAPLCVEVQDWLCCPLQTVLSAAAGTSCFPVQFPPVRFLLSPVALGRVVHMESQVDRPSSPGCIPDSSLP